MNDYERIFQNLTDDPYRCHTQQINRCVIGTSGAFFYFPGLFKGAQRPPIPRQTIIHTIAIQQCFSNNTHQQFSICLCKTMEPLPLQNGNSEVLKPPPTLASDPMSPLSPSDPRYPDHLQQSFVPNLLEIDQQRLKFKVS